MEQIILRKAYHPVMESVLKRKIILYNNEQKMLVLDDIKGIKLPKDAYYENKKIKQTLDQILPIKIKKEKIIQLVTIINYYSRFKEHNNKLNKISRELINEYYAYNIEFNQDIISAIWNSEYILSEQYLPYIISIKEFINLNKKIVNKEDIEAVKILEKKLNMK